MAYSRLNLENGTTLEASHLAHFEEAFIELMGENYNIEWEPGGIITTTGNDTNADNRRRTKNFIPIEYPILSLTPTVGFYICIYDTNKTFLSAHGWNTAPYFDVTSIAPAEAGYYRILAQTGDSLQDSYWTVGSTGQSNATREIIVDCNGSGDYTTIEDALNNANDSPTNHVIIRVRPGTYYPPPKISGNAPYNENYRNLSIIGDNKNKVILRGDCGYYYYQIQVDCAPLRLNGNITIENLTIESYSSKYTEVATANGWDLTSPHCRAYCIHIDGSPAPGDEILVKNCKLINDHFTTIGFGLKQDCTLRIENCELITTTTDDTLSGFSDYGTLYGHLAANKVATGQRLEVLYNRIVNKGYAQAINLMDGSAQTEGPEASYLLIGNVCDTTDLNNAFKVSNTYGFWTQDNLCYGNNVEAMNK